MNILVIDDEKDIRDLVSRTLTGAGYNVTSAGTVPEAEQLIIKKKWDLVISDVMIPHLGGFEIADLVKAKKDTPVILLTGMDKEILNSTLTEANAILIKPVSAQKLLDTVRETLSLQEPA